MRIRLRTVVIVLLALSLLAGCGGERNAPPAESPTPSQTGSPSPESASPVSSAPSPVSAKPKPVEVKPETTLPPDAKYVQYDGIVEHLFFHELIAYPELAFRGDYQQKGYDDNMVTVSEYNKILDSLYAEGYMLVNMNDVWGEYTDESGNQRMRRNTLMLPEGKKPLILSFDDISFYTYMDGYGFMSKLIIGDDGEIWASGMDRDGKEIITQELTAVTILDKFVKRHPDFSLGGVKGCIALTGYEGILGYRTQTDKDDTSKAFETNRQLEIARVRPVIKKLKATGWYFATHSWGHINLNNSSLGRVQEDAERWLREVGSLVGETKLFIYPFGSRLDGGDVYETGAALKYYVSIGFRVFASVGIESFSRIKPDIAAVVCDRMHADGTTLRHSRDRYMKFYDAADVFDPLRPKYEKGW